MNFEQLHIIPPILKALEAEHYKEPSPIQEKAIPPALEGRDVLGCAQTGTGKTAAFAVPILQRLSQQPIAKGARRPIRALILTPTRELAIQIADSFHAYGRYMSLRCTVVFGGVSQVPQVSSLKSGVDILVATPGRLNDLIQQGFIDLSQVQIFVLDEADRMLDMGFIHDVRKVLDKLPKKKQTLFFSATMPPEITDLVNSLLQDPFKAAVTPVSSPVDAIEQSVYFVDKENKPKLLIRLLKDPAVESALVFTRTKHGADRVVRVLTRAKIDAQAIHGNKSQAARQLALNSFKSRKIHVLVATDIAARGIDIEELSHVVNYDLPNIPETYVHRIGRTGRAGLGGIAVSFCDIDEKPYLKDIEKLIGRKVPVVEDHPYPMQVFTPAPPKQSTRRPQRMERGQAPRRAAPKAKQEAKRGKPAPKPAEAKIRRAAVAPVGKKAEKAASAPVTAAPEPRSVPGKKPRRGGRAAASPKTGRTGRDRDYDYLEMYRSREPKAPRPLIQHTQTVRKPEDQFLSDKPLKPIFHKG